MLYRATGTLQLLRIRCAALATDVRMLSASPGCQANSDDTGPKKQPYRRPQQAMLSDTRRDVRERIGERPRSDSLMTPLGLRGVRNPHRGDVSRESYQQATRALAEAHLKKLPWMSQYLKHPASSDPEGYAVLGTIGRFVKKFVAQICFNVSVASSSDSRNQAKTKTTSIDLAQTMMADFTRVRGESVMQLNANRRYRVKDTYKPDELNPYKREQERGKNRSMKISKLTHKGTLFDKHDRLPYMPEQVRREISFKNVTMLKLFTGRQGNILGRRREVPVVTQRKVARAIKNSRQMALMPHVGLHPAFPGPMAEALQEVFDHLDMRAKSGQ